MALNLQRAILDELKQSGRPVAAAELIAKIQRQNPDVTSSEIKVAISPLLSTGEIDFSNDRKLQPAAVEA